MTNSYTIAFTYLLENGRIKVDLIADVEEHHSDTWYHIKNFRTANSGVRHVLPDVQLKKQEGLWVHRDSEKETDLSRAIGSVLGSSGGNGSGKPSGE